MTHEQLKSAFEYDPLTGFFIKKQINRRVGFLGGLKRRKIEYVRAFGVNYSAHRLAWFYVHGEWPKHTIDHINGIPTDNRIENLRDATYRENNSNLKSHRNGRLVGAVNDRGRWASRNQNQREVDSIRSVRCR